MHNSSQKVAGAEALKLRTYLLATVEEELVRVHAIADGATDNREPVKHDRGLLGVPEQELTQDIQDN